MVNSTTKPPFSELDANLTEMKVHKCMFIQNCWFQWKWLWMWYCLSYMSKSIPPIVQ